ncbi:AMP-binding protein [Rhodopseudomonas palustris]|uniref:AMP-binding protein n=1 Tax=Rhodopseudomonas palustris TaxID=1076 RepID=UPI0021F32954|nr:AMP-binding protein [Rhodopseudomonas palustris]UYO53632.1 AMP-binding protein [Rhodopseudomonas palustris]
MFWRDRDQASDARTFLTTQDRALSYAQVFDAGDGLYDGCARGVVALLCDRAPETVIAYTGALRAGLVPLLLDGGAAPAAIARTLQAYRPAFLFSPTGTAPEGFAPHAKIGATGMLFAATQAAETVAHPDLALLIPTSGSTGDPKSVRITARNLQSCTDAICDYLAMTDDRVSVSLLPLHYSYGLSVLHNVMNVRGRIALTELSVLDRGLFGFCEAQGVTDIAGVPFIFDILRRARLPEGLARSLVCVTQAGGRLDPRVTKHFLERFAGTRTRYFTMYGQTEAAPRIAYVPPEAGIDKLGSVGVPISCGRARIDGEGEGELIYSGANVSMGYAQGHGDLARGDDFQGVLRTGDLATIDTDGFITITGRLKRFVKLHGISVNLDHVESVLKSAGIDCLVVGRENRVIVCYRDSEAGEVSAAMSQNFSFHPSTVALQEVDPLPRTAAGKPDYVTALKECGDAR